MVSDWLPQTIAEAASGDIIVVTNTLQTIGLGSELVIDKDLSIVGPGANRLFIEDFFGRVFRITSIVTVRMSGLNIQNGRARRGASSATASAPGLPGENGGGIHNSGQLTLTDCVLVDNLAGGGGFGSDGADRGTDGGNGGAGGNGGGIYNASSGVLWLDRCTLRANSSGAGGPAGNGGRGGNSRGVPGAGGAAGAGGPGGNGSGLCNDGKATLNRCTISANRYSSGDVGGGGNAGDGGRGGDNLPNIFGIHEHWGGNGGEGGASGFGGGLCGNGHTVLNQCTISGNIGGDGGNGGIGGSGGFSIGPLVDLGHKGAGGHGGAGGSGSGLDNNGSMELLHCTIAYNMAGLGGPGGDPGSSGSPGGSRGTNGLAGTGGGIRSGGAQPVSVFNTVADRNTLQNNTPDDVGGEFTSLGHNLVKAASFSSAQALAQAAIYAPGILSSDPWLTIAARP